MSVEVRGKYSDMDWRNIISPRNLLVHEYFGIDVSLVRRVASVQANVPRAEIAQILEAGEVD